MRASQIQREVIRRETRRAMGTAAHLHPLYASQTTGAFAEFELLALPLDVTEAEETWLLDAIPFQFDYSAFDGPDAWA
jgi:hypothetical protein